MDTSPSAQASGRIRVLEDALADQIAAGEVVERPFSVVKELVENALDAEPTRIEIRVARGGTDEIVVSDDGIGMVPADAQLALRRHATSKIRALTDLVTISTLGFRGEALPSIASVSRLRLDTRPPDALEGTRVRVEGGGKPDVRPVGCAAGTTVQVRDLFFNVPARRKFLKSVATEAAHVTEVIKRAAMAHPQVRFVLTRDERTVLDLPASDLPGRIQRLFARETLRTIESEAEGVGVHAMLGPPERARSGALGLHLFVNGRPVRDRGLARAVAFAYGSVLPPGHYPIGALYLRVDPSSVDINVHPQKSEVRFAQARGIYDATTRQIASALGHRAWGGARGPASRPDSYWENRLSGVRESIESGPDPWDLNPHAAPDASGPQGTSGSPASPAKDATTLPLAAEPGFFASLRVLGQVRKMLIVCAGSDGLYVIDQHAADERIGYHRLRQAYRDRSVAQQQLLLPERIALSPQEITWLGENTDAVLACGIDAHPLGNELAAVRAIPAVLGRADPGRLLRDLLGELMHVGDRAFGDAVDMAFATMACHAAIRAGDTLSHQECEALLAKLDEVDDFAGHCPHGRPIAYSVRWGEIERSLGR